MERESPPPGMGGMAVRISGAHIGAPGTPQTLKELLGKLRTVDVVQAAGKLLLTLERPGVGLLAAQREIVRRAFPPDIGQDYLRALDAGGNSGGFDIVFYPSQLLILQRLALVLCQPGPPNSFNDGADVGRFVVASAQVGDVADPHVPDAAIWTELDSALFAFRASERDKLVHAPQAAGRSYLLWIDSRLAWPNHLETPNDYCQRTFGVSLRSFMSIAAAPAIGRLDIDILGLNEVPFNIEQYFAKSKVRKEKAEEILRALTYHPVDTDPDRVLLDPATFWCFFDFAATPFLPAGEDLIMPCSIRYSFERASSGIFWMMHASLQGQVGSLTTHFGNLFEDYCLRITEPLKSEDTTVSREVEYGSAATRRKSSDILVSTSAGEAPGRVFVECRAGRPPRAVFAHGSVVAFRRYLDDLVEKLGQLDRSIRDHLSGEFQIRGDLAGRDDPYLPVLVVDIPFRWTFVLRNILDAEIENRGLFADVRITKPIVCSIEEFENLIFACEQGINLCDLLRAYLLTDRLDPLEQFLYDKFGNLQIPSVTSSGWEQFQKTISRELFGCRSSLSKNH